MCLLSRVVFWMVRHSIFKVRVVGQRNAPHRGPALLAANHVTYADGFLIGSCVRPPIRFLAWEQLYHVRFCSLVLQAIKAIPVRESSPREVLATILQARQALAEGHVICIFPEGYLTRTGDLLPFKRGMEKIVEGLDVPIIPIHLDQLWGSVFSFAGGRFFWKLPQHLRHPVTISFGAAMPSDSSVNEVRQAIQELGAEATSYRKTKSDTVPCDARERVKKSTMRARSGVGGFKLGGTMRRRLNFAPAVVRRQYLISS